MLTAEQRNEFDQYGIVRMPGAVAKSAAEEMLATVWNCLRDRYHIHRDAPDTWPDLNAARWKCSRSVERIGLTALVICRSRKPLSRPEAQPFAARLTSY